MKRRGSSIPLGCRTWTLGLAVLALACGSDRLLDACGNPIEPTFLDGTPTDPQIGLLVSSLNRSFIMFQLGNPSEVREVPLGGPVAAMPKSFSRSGTLVAVPLAPTRSVAIVDIRRLRVTRIFEFLDGTAGELVLSGRSVLVTNPSADYIGRFTITQPGSAITDTLAVPPAPTGIVTSLGSQAVVVSANVADRVSPVGDGIVTAINPATFDVFGRVSTGGTNPQAAAMGPDKLLYVVNTGDFVQPGALGIIDPINLKLVDVIRNIGVGPEKIFIDPNGLAYISGSSLGTVVFDITTRQFVRGPDNPVCARLPDGSCRGASAAATGRDETLFQVFSGNEGAGLDPWIFVYQPGTFALRDSIATVRGARSIEVAIIGRAFVQPDSDVVCFGPV